MAVDLKKAKRKANARDRRYLDSYSATRDRLDWILRSRGIFLSNDRKKSMVANIRSGLITFDYVRDQTDRWGKQQRVRALDANRGGSSDFDLQAIRRGYSGILNRIETIYRTAKVPLSGEEAGQMARSIATGKKTFDHYRGRANRVASELYPAGNVQDIADDQVDAEVEEYDFNKAVQGMFPFLNGELVDAFVEGWSDTGDVESGLQSMRANPAYEKYFPGNELAPGTYAMAEADYVSYRTQARDLMREYGIPGQYFDRDEDFGTLVRNQVKLSQLEERIRKGYVAAMQAPESVRSELSRDYGVGIGDLAAFWLDPTRGEDVLQRKYTEAQIRSAATDTGFGQLSLEDSEMLAAQGVTRDAAMEGMTGLVEGRGLFEGMIGSREDDIGLQEQLAATFLGDANQRDKIRRRAESRIAAFGGGGGAASTEQGVAGLRTAE